MGKRNIERNRLKVTEAKKTDQAQRTIQKMKLVINEITSWSGGRRAAYLRKIENPQEGANRDGPTEIRIEKPKHKIPSLVDGESSDTCDSEGWTDSESDSDSIPPINL